MTLLGSAAASAAPMPSHAQQVPTLGFLAAAVPHLFADRVAAFRDGLRRGGFVDGRNLTIDYRWAEPGKNDLVLPLARELVERKVSVIAVGNVISLAKSATDTIPIVSLFGGDPVRSNLVASLNRPGGNLTGISLFAFSLGAKRFQLLREAVPNANLIAVLVNPTQPDPGSKADVQEVEAAAASVGQRILVLNASSDRDFAPAFAAMARESAGALLVMGDPFLNAHRDQLIALAARYTIPAIYEWRESAHAGGLMSYGSSLLDAYHHLGDYAARILKGATPQELPVQQQVKVELVLNLKTAKLLDIALPLSLLGRADEVIE